jgi:hypothetical protein
MDRAHDGATLLLVQVRGHPPAVGIPGVQVQGVTIPATLPYLARRCMTYFEYCHTWRSRMAANRAITVRISQTRLRKLMRARRVATQSELINTLLAEEEERLRSHAVLRDTAHTVRAGEVDGRLL